MGKAIKLLKSGRVKPPKPQVPRTRSGGFKLPDGPWKLGYGHIDRVGLFAWPAPGAKMAAELAQIMQAFAELPMEQLRQVTRKNGKAAHKFIELHELTDDARRRWDDLADGFGEDAQPELFEFTYCLRDRDPRRIWAAFVRGRTLHPIWWDPRHEVCGYDSRLAGSHVGGPCPDECLHPSRVLDARDRSRIPRT